MSNPFNESDEAARARRGRNILLALALGAFVVIVFLISIAKISANVAHH